MQIIDVFPAFDYLVDPLLEVGFGVIFCQAIKDDVGYLLGLGFGAAPGGGRGEADAEAAGE